MGTRKTNGSFDETIKMLESAATHVCDGLPGTVVVCIDAIARFDVYKLQRRFKYACERTFSPREVHVRTACSVTKTQNLGILKSLKWVYNNVEADVFVLSRYNLKFKANPLWKIPPINPSHLYLLNPMQTTTY